MRIDDEIANKIELAGLKGTAIEKLAMAATFSKNPIWKERLNRILHSRILLAEETHPFPSPDDEELVPGEISLGTIIRMDGSLGTGLSSDRNTA